MSRLKNGKIIECNNCGKPIYKPRRILLRYSHYFCSRSCSQSYFVGIKHRMFKNNSMSQTFKRRLLNGAKCVLCKETDRDVLVLHHKDGNRKNNKIENLVVLCANCHIKVHKEAKDKFVMNLSVPKCFYKILNKNAKKPFKREVTDAGFDLYSTQKYIIAPQTWCEIDYGISVEIPLSYYGMLALRSKWGKNGLIQHIGIVDNSFRGRLSGFVYNASKEEIVIEKGDRVSQLIIQPYLITKVCEVKQLSKTERGSKGFGSSGR